MRNQLTGKLAVYVSIISVLASLLLPGFSHVQAETTGQTVSGYVFDISGDGGTGGTLPPVSGGYPSTPIMFGSTIDASFTSDSPQHTDGTHYSLYSFHAESGQKIAISMSSSDFDPYVQLWDSLDPYTANVLLKNRGSATGSPAALPAAGGYYTCPSTGTYYIFANTFKAGSTGAYSLSLVGEPLAGVTLVFSAVSGTGAVPDPVFTDASGSWGQSGFEAGTTYRITPSLTTGKGIEYEFTPDYLDFDAAQYVDKQLNLLGRFPEIKLNAPGPGQTLTAGDPWEVKWSYSGYIGETVSIALRKKSDSDKGVTVCDISAGANGTGSYQWASSPSLEPGNDYEFRVASETDGKVFATRSFSVSASTLSLTSPNGGEILAMGQPYDITWGFAGNSAARLKIELIKGDLDAEPSITTLTDAQDISANSYAWRINDTGITPGTDYRIRLTRNDTGFSVISTNSFSIIEATYQVGGTVHEIITDIYGGTIPPGQRIPGVSFSDTPITYNQTIEGKLDHNSNKCDFGPEAGLVFEVYSFKAYAGQRVAIEATADFEVRLSLNSSSHNLYNPRPLIVDRKSDSVRLPATGYFTIPNTGEYFIYCGTHSTETDKTFTISLKAPPITGTEISFEALQGQGMAPSSVQSDADGVWTATLPAATTYRAMPIKDGYHFVPAYADFGQAATGIDFTGFVLVNKLEVTSPTSATTWTPGVEQTISWTYYGDIGEDVKLSLMKDGVSVAGVSIPDAAIGTLGEGSCKWTPPVTLEPGDGYSIRAESITDPVICADSASFTIGIMTASGRVRPAQWFIADSQLPDTGGKPIQPLQIGTTLVSGIGLKSEIAYPYPLGPYYLQIDGYNYRSDKGHYFYAKAGQNIEVTAWADLGENLRVCVVQSDSNGALDVVGISKRITGGANYPIFHTFTVPADGIYMLMGICDTNAATDHDWAGCEIIANMGMPGVTLEVKNENSDALDPISTDLQGYWKLEGLNGGPYRITPDYTNWVFNPDSLEFQLPGTNYDFMGTCSTISMASPKYGDDWALGTSQTIGWNYTITPGQTVQIELLEDGSVIRTIADSPIKVPMGADNSGSYTWQVPTDLPVGNYRVRVTSVEYGEYSATSPEFTITNPLTVTAPAGSSAWSVGTTKNISWNYGNADIGSAVKLELLKNSILVGDPIVASTPAGTNGIGSYAWTLPLILEPGTGYQIRASSVDYPTIDATSANFSVAGKYTCSGNTLLGYNGPVSHLNSQGGNTGAIVVPIALGQTINGNIDASDYFYPEAGGGIYQDEYQLVLHQDTEIALELYAPNGGYIRAVMYCDHATLPNGNKETISALRAGDLVGNNIYRRPKDGFGDLSLGENAYFPGLYRIVVFSDTPGPYTLRVLSPIAGTHINFTVENGDVKAPQPAISDSNGQWSRNFDPASTYQVTAEKPGYSVSPVSRTFDGPSGELDFELFPLVDIPEITNLTLDNNIGVAGQIQTVNAMIQATGAADGTPVSICLLNDQGSNPLAPLFYPGDDLYYTAIRAIWENVYPGKRVVLNSIAANGTIVNGQATVTMVIPDKLAPGYYQVRAQVAGSAAIKAKDYSITAAADVPLISSISLTPAQHYAGQSQYVDVSVETANVGNGTSVTAALVNNDGSPLTPPVGSVTGVISDNHALLRLYSPGGVPAGHYSVKVTVFSAGTLTGLKPYHIANNPDVDAVDAAINALTWENIKGGNITPENIITNLVNPLPTSGANGTTISWSAYPANWINTTTGAVTRPTPGQGHQTVTLTAAISKGTISGFKNFILTITDPSIAATPRANLGSGAYGGTQNITLATITEGAMIYYTTDNSDPTSSSTRIQYTGVIEVTTNTTIKAIAIKESMQNSPVSILEYVIFAGGDGSEANPYQVATPEQLDNVRKCLDKHFIQTADIDLDAAPYNAGDGWAPIGSNGSPFTGSFDGNGNIISNLTINRSLTDYVGLFGFAGANAEINNVGLENTGVNGKKCTGALVGENHGTITNSYTTGIITGTDTYVGGLVGLNKNAISGSYTTGTVNGKQCTGGLVGDNYGGTITLSYSTSTVTGKGGVAGLAGGNSSGTITNSYARGAATGTEDHVGGLVGWNNEGNISYTYATGAVKGRNFVGGLVGEKGTVSKSYWDKDASGKNSSAGGEGRITSLMKEQETYVTWDFADVWNIEGSRNDGYPFLKNTPPYTAPATKYPITIAGVTGGTATVSTNPATEAAAGVDVTVSIADIEADKQFKSITVTDADSGAVTITPVTAGSSYTFTMPAKAVTVTVAVEAIPVVSATINPATANFDKKAAAQADVSTTITWNSATIVTEVKKGDAALTADIDYSVAGTTLTIKKEYLATQGVGDVTLSIVFDKGNVAALTINISDTTPASPTIISITAANNVEVAYGTTEGDALASLASTTTIIDSNNDAHVVNLSWCIANYDRNTAGDYTATGTFALPAGVDQSDPETELKVTATVTVNAEVPAPTYPLIITAATGGSITTGSSGNYVADTVIAITATPSSGYSFNKWTSTGGGTFANANNSSTAYTMPANSAEITASFTYQGSSGGGPGGGDTGDSGTGGGGTGESSTGGGDTTPTIAATLTAGTYEKSLDVSINKTDGSVLINLDESTVNEAFDMAEADSNGKKTICLDAPEVQGVNSYILELPVALLSSESADRYIEMASEVGVITLPSNMLEGMQFEGTGDVSISIGQGDKSALPDEVQRAIGDRPLVQLNLSLDGVATEWNNPDAPVTVSIPYEPTAEELKVPEYIVVWYIDGSGNVVSVPNGRYDPATGTVTFTTTHFSHYAIAYEHKTFADLGKVTWAKPSIEVLASKGIVRGVSENEYFPQDSITRADFLCFLVRTLGLETRFASNFDDIGEDACYYREIGVAKKLDITHGTGNNKFSPDASITRQDMMVLTVNALKMLKRLQQQGSAADLQKFVDRSLVATYAKPFVATAVKEGLIVGSGGGKVNPLGNTTRAEAAVFLYRIYCKY